MLYMLKGTVKHVLRHHNTEADAIELAKKGKGSLVCSIVTTDTKIARDFVLGAGTHHGSGCSEAAGNDCQHRAACWDGWVKGDRA